MRNVTEDFIIFAKKHFLRLFVTIEALKCLIQRRDYELIKLVVESRIILRLQQSIIGKNRQVIDAHYFRFVGILPDKRRRSALDKNSSYKVEKYIEISDMFETVLMLNNVKLHEISNLKETKIDKASQKFIFELFHYM